MEVRPALTDESDLNPEHTCKTSVWGGLGHGWEMVHVMACLESRDLEGSEM